MKKINKQLTAITLAVMSMGFAHAQSEINYNTGASNINNNKTVVNKERDTTGKNIMTPDESMRSTSVNAHPVTPPSGLPNDISQQDTGRIISLGSNGGQRDKGVEDAINLLNTDKSKIKAINKDLFDTGRVANELPVTAPKVINHILKVNIGPGSVSPVVRGFKNRTTTVTIADASGQPWPILNYDGLPKENFTVNRLDAPAPIGYVLSVTPLGSFVSGNLQITLKGLNGNVFPVNIEFLTGQRELDGNLELRVQAAGPNSLISSVGMPGSIDSELTSVLQGISPKNGKEVKSSTKAVQAWINRDGQMFIRTRYKVMSPAFREVASSPDGTFAYKMEAVESVLYKSEDGRFGEFTVELK